MKGLKFDEDKDRWYLLPFEVLKEVVRVFTLGAKKYGDFNWALVENPEERYFSALVRHLVAYRSGEELDPEWGTPHLAHLIFNAIALRWFQLRGAKKK